MTTVLDKHISKNTKLQWQRQLLLDVLDVVDDDNVEPKNK